LLNLLRCGLSTCLLNEYDGDDVVTDKVIQRINVGSITRRRHQANIARLTPLANRASTHNFNIALMTYDSIRSQYYSDSAYSRARAVSCVEVVSVACRSRLHSVA